MATMLTTPVRGEGCSRRSARATAYEASSTSSQRSSAASAPVTPEVVRCTTVRPSNSARPPARISDGELVRSKPSIGSSSISPTSSIAGSTERKARHASGSPSRMIRRAPQWNISGSQVKARNTSMTTASPSAAFAPSASDNRRICIGVLLRVSPGHAYPTRAPPQPPIVRRRRDCASGGATDGAARRRDRSYRAGRWRDSAGRTPAPPAGGWRISTKLGGRALVCAM